MQPLQTWVQKLVLHVQYSPMMNEWKLILNLQTGKIAELANQNKNSYCWPWSRTKPRKIFDKVIEINLSTLEPHIVGPHTPDLARPISPSDDTRIKYIDEISVALLVVVRIHLMRICQGQQACRTSKS